jgi:hypothetical protein
MPPKRQLQVEEVINEIETKKQKTTKASIFNSDEVNHYLSMKKTWELSNEIDKEALRRAFPDYIERSNFIDLLKKYHRAKVEEFENIENRLPKLRSHPSFYQIKPWKKNILSGPKRGAEMFIQRLGEYGEEFEEEDGESVVNE